MSCNATDFPTTDCYNLCLSGEINRTMNCLQCYQNGIVNTGTSYSYNCWDWCISGGLDNYSTCLEKRHHEYIFVCAFIVFMLCMTPTCIYLLISDWWKRRTLRAKEEKQRLTNSELTRYGAVPNDLPGDRTFMP